MYINPSISSVVRPGGGGFSEPVSGRKRNSHGHTREETSAEQDTRSRRMKKFFKSAPTKSSNTSYGKHLVSGGSVFPRSDPTEFSLNSLTMPKTRDSLEAAKLLPVPAIATACERTNERTNELLVNSASGRPWSVVSFIQHLRHVRTTNLVSETRFVMHTRCASIPSISLRATRRSVDSSI